MSPAAQPGSAHHGSVVVTLARLKLNNAANAATGLVSSLPTPVASDAMTDISDVRLPGRQLVHETDGPLRPRGGGVRRTTTRRDARAAEGVRMRA